MASILKQIDYVENGTIDFNLCEIKIKGRTDLINMKFLRYKTKNGYYEVKNYSDFLKHKKSLYLKVGVKEYKQVVVEQLVFTPQNHFRPIVTSTSFTTPNSIKLKSGDNVESLNIQSGVSRTLSATGKTLSKDNNYIMIQMYESKEVLYIKKSDIIYYNEAGKPVKLYDYFSGEVNAKQFAEFIEKNKFYYEGKLINSVYAKKEFVFDRLESFERINSQNLTIETINLNPSPSKKKNEYVVNGEIKVRNIDPYVSEQNYFTVEEKVDNKTKQVSKIKVKNYQISKNGEFIKVRMLDSLNQIMVNLSNVYPLDNDSVSLTNQNINDYEGMQVRIKQADGTFLPTKPLTAEQVMIKFDSIKSFEPVNDDSVKPLADNAFVRLSNGKYIKEKDARQAIAYSYQNDENKSFDAYLVKVKDKDEYVVVTKEFYNENQSSQFVKTQEGKELEFATVRRVVRTNDLTKCDVVQISSKRANVEACVVVNDSNRKTTVENLQNNLKEWTDEQYAIDSVFNDKGELLEIDRSKASRYTFTDEFVVDDHAMDSSAASLKEARDKLDYQALQSDSVIFNENAKTKFGKFKYANDGPKYDAAKANGKAFKIWGKLLGGSCLGFCTPAGILVGLAVPVAVAAFGVGMVAAIPGIPIYNAIHAWRVNRNKAVIKDKTTIQRNQDKREIEDQLDNLLVRANTIRKKLEKDKTLTPKEIADLEEQFNEIQKRIVMMSKTNVNLDFKMEDGKCKVTPETAIYIKKYINQNKTEFKNLDEIQKQINDLEKKLKKFKGTAEAKTKLENEIEALKSLLKNKKENLYNNMKEYIGVESEKGVAPYREELKDKTNTVKALLYLKLIYKGQTKIRDAEIDLSLIKEETLNDLDYDVKKGVLLYRNTSIEKLKAKDASKLTNGEKLLLLKIYNIEQAIKTLKEKGVKQTSEELLENASTIQNYNNLEVIEENENDLEVVEENEVEHNSEEELESNPVVEEQVVEQFEENRDARNKPANKFDAKIVSEDALVKILIANKESKDRKKLIAYITNQSGVEISEKDINATIKAIDRRHKNNRNARAGAHNYSNKNICLILDYGQEFLTKHAVSIKDNIVRNF